MAMFDDSTVRQARQPDLDDPPDAKDDADNAKIEAMDTMLRIQDALFGVADPEKCGNYALIALCDFYGADWCGIFDYDKNLKPYMPYWWYNTDTKGMPPMRFDDIGISGDFPWWADALENNKPIVLTDVSKIKEQYPNEYKILTMCSAKSLMAVPYYNRGQGFLLVRNQTRHIKNTELLTLMAHLIITEISIYEMQRKANLKAAPSCMREDVDVTINLFGGLEICTKQGRLDEETIKSPLCCKLFVFLLINRHKNVHPREIAGRFWPDRDIEDGINHTRVLIFRFRKLFKLISPKFLILTTNNGYRINPELTIHTDYEEFERICAEGKPMSNSQQRMALFDRAFRIHKGTLFPTGAQELWLMPVIERLHTLYTEMINELLSAAHEQCNHKMLYEYAQLAMSIDPDCPPIIFWLIIAYQKDGQTTKAKAYLKKAKERLIPEEYDELEQLLAEQCPRKDTCDEPCNAMCRFCTGDAE